MDAKKGIEVVVTINDCCTPVLSVKVEKVEQGLCRYGHNKLRRSEY